MYRQYLLIPSVFLTLSSLYGCSTTVASNGLRGTTGDAGSDPALESAQRRVSELESELAERDQRLARAEAEGGASASLQQERTLVKKEAES